MDTIRSICIGGIGYMVCNPAILGMEGEESIDNTTHRWQLQDASQTMGSTKTAVDVVYTAPLVVEETPPPLPPVAAEQQVAIVLYGSNWAALLGAGGKIATSLKRYVISQLKAGESFLFIVPSFLAGSNFPSQDVFVCGDFSKGGATEESVRATLSNIVDVHTASEWSEEQMLHFFGSTYAGKMIDGCVRLCSVVVAKCVWQENSWGGEFVGDAVDARGIRSRPEVRAGSWRALCVRPFSAP